MKSEFYIAGIILIVLICLLFFFHIRKKKKKFKHLIDEFTKLATQNKRHITKFDVCDSMIIGMDEHSGHVLFFKSGKTENMSTIINLSDIESCKISNHIKKSQPKNKTNHNEDLTGILLKPYNGNKPEVYLCFKCKEDKNQDAKSFMLTYKWSYLINNRLFAMR